MFSKKAGTPMAAVLLLAACVAFPQTRDSASPPNLSSEQIVEQMQRHNQVRAGQLKHYTAVRHYQVEYKGFSTTIEAKMEVEVNYDSSSGKSFKILSQSGSNFLLEKVLKRAVDSEKEASRDKGTTALTPANYRFHLAGNENLAGRPAYILEVEPIIASKFLYKGRVWVDAADLALVKIEAQPAKNPSFWISQTSIRTITSKSGDFWFPERTRSETKVRIGGTAVFTIDYGTYKVTSEESRLEAGR